MTHAPTGPSTMGGVWSLPGRGEASPARGAARDSFAALLERSLASPGRGAGIAPGDAPSARAGREGLRWAAAELEAQIWAVLLREATQSGKAGGLFGASFAGNVYGDWFADVLARLVVDAGPGRLAGLLLEEFSQAVPEGDELTRVNRGASRQTDEARGPR